MVSYSGRPKSEMSSPFSLSQHPQTYSSLFSALPSEVRTHLWETILGHTLLEYGKLQTLMSGIPAVQAYDAHQLQYRRLLHAPCTHRDHHQQCDDSLAECKLPWPTRWCYRNWDAPGRPCACHGRNVVSLLRTCQRLYVELLPMLYIRTKVFVPSTWALEHFSKGGTGAFDSRDLRLGGLRPLRELRSLHVYLDGNEWRLMERASHALEALIGDVADLRELSIALLNVMVLVSSAQEMSLIVAPLCGIRGLKRFRVAFLSSGGCTPRGRGNVDTRTNEYLERMASLIDVWERTVNDVLSEVVCDGEGFERVGEGGSRCRIFSMFSVDFRKSSHGRTKKIQRPKLRAGVGLGSMSGLGTQFDSRNQVLRQQWYLVQRCLVLPCGLLYFFSGLLNCHSLLNAPTSTTTFPQSRIFRDWRAYLTTTGLRLVRLPSSLLASDTIICSVHKTANSLSMHDVFDVLPIIIHHPLLISWLRHPDLI